jgi:hypothetical protein
MRCDLCGCVGVILLLGKHQFIVERIENGTGISNTVSNSMASSSEADDKTGWDDHARSVAATAMVSPRAQTPVGGTAVENSEIEDIVGEAEELLNALEMMDSNMSEEERCVSLLIDMEHGNVWVCLLIIIVLVGTMLCYLMCDLLLGKRSSKQE